MNCVVSTYNYSILHKLTFINDNCGFLPEKYYYGQSIQKSKTIMYYHDKSIFVKYLLSHCYYRNSYATSFVNKGSRL